MTGIVVRAGKLGQAAAALGVDGEVDEHELTVSGQRRGEFVVRFEKNADLRSSPLRNGLTGRRHADVVADDHVAVAVEGATIVDRSRFARTALRSSLKPSEERVACAGDAVLRKTVCITAALGAFAALGTKVAVTMNDEGTCRGKLTRRPFEIV